MEIRPNGSTPHLEPCPCCGGEANIVEMILGYDEETITVKCQGCGLRLTKNRKQIKKQVWDPTLQRHRMAPSGLYLEESAIDLWNRRVST